MSFLKQDHGLATVEWVGIGAVMVLAAIAITSFVMQGVDQASDQVTTGLESVDASNPGIGVFGDGLAGTVN